MRRHILFLSSAVSILCLATMLSRADEVPVSKAQTVARNFLEGTPVTKASSTLRLVWDGRSGVSTKASSSDPAPYYVFAAADESFVIVAGDDCCRPVLGYSLDGNGFDPDNIPGGLAILLEGYAGNIRKIRRGEMAPEPGTKALWDELLTPTKASSNAVAVKELNTALWNQVSPYNAKCPTYNGKNLYTGCGATALAIVMKYHEWPDCGYGTVPAYTSIYPVSGTDTLKIDIAQRTLGHSYDWSSMKDSYSSGETAEEVATLMADLGHIIKANYGPDGTSASNNQILNVLKYMKYDAGASHKWRSSFTTDAWIQLCKNDIEAGLPVIYSGQSYTQGGHAYVLDGYDSENYFHFNWGWGGYNNGYFFITDTEFSNDEDAFFGFSPNRSWTEPEEKGSLTYCEYEYDSTYWYGLWTDTPYPETGKAFDVHVSLLNNGYAAYNGKLKLVLRHSDGSEEDIAVMSESTTMNVNNIYKFTFSVTLSSINEGDEILLYWQDDGEWVPVDGGLKTLKLRYSIPDEVSLSYETSSSGKTLTFCTTRLNMTISAGGQSATFTTKTVSLTTSGSGTLPVTISNGHDSYTVNIKL